MPLGTRNVEGGARLVIPPANQSDIGRRDGGQDSGEEFSDDNDGVQPSVRSLNGTDGSVDLDSSSEVVLERQVRAPSEFNPSSSYLVRVNPTAR